MGWIEVLVCDGCGDPIPFRHGGERRQETEARADGLKWKRRVADGCWYCPTCALAVAAKGFAIVAPKRYQEEPVHAERDE